jgi:hypothetical protein
VVVTILYITVAACLGAGVYGVEGGCYILYIIVAASLGAGLYGE